MFKRKWSALPPDPIFPSDLKGLGYFINDEDEVRSIENEDNYFKFFISRNPRFCERQRFSMNLAIQDEIHKRFIALGLCKVNLPTATATAFGATTPNVPRVPIFVSDGIAEKSRVVIIFGETTQDLGVLAHRVLGGRGGINKGSLVSVVKALSQQQCSPSDPSAPGIILANMGELIWWPEGERTLCTRSFDATPMPSAAHLGNYIDARVNRVPGHETPKAHVQRIFEDVVPMFANETAGFDIVGLGDGADIIESYFNCDATWERVGRRINCFASVGGQFHEKNVTCGGLREFLKDRARAYVPSAEPLGLILSSSSGNPNTTTFTSLGCPVFSAGEPQHVETLFIASYPIVLEWLQEVATTPVNQQPYANPTFLCSYSDGTEDDDSLGSGGGKSDSEDDVEADGGVSAGFTGLRIVKWDAVVETDSAVQPEGETDDDKKVGMDQK
ncbi:hypothetical protein F5Y14DRAFT_193665 [Nemania sp. NC0429]|nr:hypothetical protein F5Y14DRAFT_193665 [Nemania sp. NC0429]